MTTLGTKVSVKWLSLQEHTGYALHPIRSVGCYEPIVAQGDIPEPVWPELTMDQILTIAFGSTHVIMDHEHPALQKLWGLE